MACIDIETSRAACEYQRVAGLMHLFWPLALHMGVSENKGRVA